MVAMELYDSLFDGADSRICVVLPVFSLRVTKEPCFNAGFDRSMGLKLYTESYGNECE